MNKKIFVGLVAILVIATWVGVSYPKTPSEISVDKIVNEVKEKVKTFGSVPTLDGVDNPFVSINGVRQYWYNQPISATSSIPCSIRNPFNATSTMLAYTVRVTTNGIASAQVVDISTSTIAYGSSTPAFIKAFTTPATGFELTWLPGASSTPRLVGFDQLSTTVGTGLSGVIIRPTEYVNFRISTTTPGTFATHYVGTCRAVFQQL